MRLHTANVREAAAQKNSPKTKVNNLCPFGRLSWKRSDKNTRDSRSSVSPSPTLTPLIPIQLVEIISERRSAVPGEIRERQKSDVMER